MRAVDVYGVTHAAVDQEDCSLETLCGQTGRWRHLTTWWSPLLMSQAEDGAVVDCMACLVAEASP